MPSPERLRQRDTQTDPSAAPASAPISEMTTDSQRTIART